MMAIAGLALATRAVAEEAPVLHFTASWAGLPAAEIDVALTGDAVHYRDKIDISSAGLPRLFTNFHGDASSEGALTETGSAAPVRYDALYSLRRRHDKRIALRVVEQDGAQLTVRAPEDTSTKPPLAEPYRRNVLDPIAALAAIRQYLATHPHQPGQGFTLPVFDGARRFDVVARIVAPEGPPETGPEIQMILSLRPIAGFKGESSEDGDPDNGPRDVELHFTDDARLLPLYLRVRIAHLPLVVRFEKLCPALKACTE